MKSFLDYLAEQDASGYLYHVTMIRKLPSIKKNGIMVNQKSAFEAGSYPAYSKNKIFLTDSKGLDFWKDRIENVEFDQFDDPKGVAVLTINILGLDIQNDEIGSKDSWSNAFYTTKNIPPNRIVNIQEFPEEI